MKLVTLLLAIAGSQVARADLLGAYFGVAAGQGNVKVNSLPTGGKLGFDEKHTAWKVLVGIRAISVLGAEFEYLDFGRSSATLGPAAPVGTVVNIDAKLRGAALFAMGYLPLPIPLLDIYGKAGFARLQATQNILLPTLVCVAAPCNNFHVDNTDTSFAWGAGVQVKLPITSLAVRAEYQHFNLNNGAPDLLTAGILWRF